jgi:peptidoglycan hydrolase CwlO-like protein
VAHGLPRHKMVPPLSYDRKANSPTLRYLEELAMIKKAVVGTAITLMLGLFFFGRDMVSYVNTSAQYMKDSVKDSVPTEFQIERARNLITDLGPEIEKNMLAIAREEVEVERIEKQIADTETRLADQKQDLLRLRTDVATGKEVFTYGRRAYTVEQVKLDLSNRFDRYQTGERTLNCLQDKFRARSNALAAAQDKLQALMSAKDDLAAEIESLEAQAEMVAAAEAANAYHFDDSKLGRVRQLVSDLKTRLDVEARMANSEDYYSGQIQLDEEAPENIADRVSEYFQLDKPQTEALALD